MQQDLSSYKLNVFILAQNRIQMSSSIIKFIDACRGLTCYSLSHLFTCALSRFMISVTNFESSSFVRGHHKSSTMKKRQKTDKNLHIYAIGCKTEVDGDVISGPRIKTIEGYAAQNVEVASSSSFRDFPKFGRVKSAAHERNLHPTGRS